MENDETAKSYTAVMKKAESALSAKTATSATGQSGDSVGGGIPAHTMARQPSLGNGHMRATEAGGSNSSIEPTHSRL